MLKAGRIWAKQTIKKSHVAKIWVASISNLILPVGSQLFSRGTSLLSVKRNGINLWSKGLSQAGRHKWVTHTRQGIAAIADSTPPTGYMPSILCQSNPPPPPFIAHASLLSHFIASVYTWKNRKRQRMSFCRLPFVFIIPLISTAVFGGAVSPGLLYGLVEWNEPHTSVYDVK